MTNFGNERCTHICEMQAGESCEASNCQSSIVHDDYYSDNERNFSFSPLLSVTPTKV
jgi:hypothetical protein